MRFFQKIRENLGRILLFAALSVVALLLFLYYFGVYDLSFIERPASWNHSISDFLAPFTRKEDPAQTSEEETSGPETTGTDPATEPVTSSDPSDPGEEILYNYPSVGQMQASGYALTDKVYEPGQTVLAVLNTSSVRFPMFSLSKKTVSEPYFIYLTAKDEKYNNRTVAYRDVQVERPVFDLYMGYILKDNAGSIAVMNNAGETILSFKTDEYLPAYTRDKAGRALFYKTVEKTVTIPEREVLQEDGVTYVTEPARDYVYQAKEYYFINEAKKRFDLSTYVDETDNRGLYFDYPAYYGTGDGSIRREVQVVERFYTDLEGNDNREVLLTWRFRNKTGYLFTRAYEYSEGRAVAEYTYTLERTNSAGETTEYTITAMQILNDKGKAIFRPYRAFRYSSWYLYEWYLFPETNGVESVGSLYYDHGLMMVRRQRVDYSFYVVDNIKMVMEDTNYLMDKEGNLVDIPSGTKLVSYSNGVLLLQDEEGHYCYYDYRMCKITDPVFREAKAFAEGLGVACNLSGKWGVIDSEGNTVIPFEFAYISQISSGLIACYGKGGWTVFQKMAK